MEAVAGSSLKLVMIDSRGTKVYPGGFPETLTGDTWRCRFMASNNTVKQTEVIELLSRVEGAGVNFIKLESLFNFDGQAGYSLGQGQ
jgi:isocitrate dehydrogenase